MHFNSINTFKQKETEMHYERKDHHFPPYEKLLTQHLQTKAKILENLKCMVKKCLKRHLLIVKCFKCYEICIG